MKKLLQIPDYANDIDLFEKYTFEEKHPDTIENLLDTLLIELKEEQHLTMSYPQKRKLLHAKLNTLPPNTLSTSAIEKLNQLLQNELLTKKITDAKKISKDSTRYFGDTQIEVWQGDITTLKADAIVNAANSQMLGCFQPLHMCIDNAIHTAAGVQLRDDCHTIIQKQGFAEPTGEAKITRAYNLPSNFVIHTVGPIVQGAVSQQSRNQLASVYNSCLDITTKVTDIRNIAFCGISTGVFGYPAEQAAQIAIKTVRHWLENHPPHLDTVVFNVFSNKDKMIYHDLLKEL